MGPKDFLRHIALPKFFQQMRRVFSSKWKYLQWAPGKYFPCPANSADRQYARQFLARTHFP
jgi:hypothetical protein